MEINSDLDLGNDLKYVKTTLNKYTDVYRKFEENILLANKTFASRFYFICFQFRNIFDKSLWL